MDVTEIINVFEKTVGRNVNNTAGHTPAFKNEHQMKPTKKKLTLSG